jgi:hypothetical protein
MGGVQAVTITLALTNRARAMPRFLWKLRVITLALPSVTTKAGNFRPT